MSFTARITGFGLAVALAATLVAARAHAVTPERELKLGYVVYLGGLHVFSFTTDFTLNGENYSIKGWGESRGVIRLFWRWAATITAGGTVGTDGVRSQIYNVATFRKDRNRSLQLSFDGPGRFTIRRDPPDPPYRAKKRETPKSIPVGTFDPLTISLVVGRAVSLGQGCVGKFPVFDGNRRYDLTFKDQGTEMLDRTAYSVFSGAAHRCTFEMKRISGFRQPREYVRYWDEDGFEPPRVWVARIVPDMPFVPVRLAGDLNMGGLRIYLIWAEYEGKPLFPGAEPPQLQQARNK